MKTELESADYEIEIDGVEYYVYFDIIWEWENDGIGHYEYWGQKCFDAGTWSSSIHDVVIKSIHHIDDETDAELQVSDEIKEKIIQHIFQTAKY
jgi:hypothetical protein